MAVLGVRALAAQPPQDSLEFRVWGMERLPAEVFKPTLVYFWSIGAKAANMRKMSTCGSLNSNHLRLQASINTYLREKVGTLIVSILQYLFGAIVVRFLGSECRAPRC